MTIKRATDSMRLFNYGTFLIKLRNFILFISGLPQPPDEEHDQPADPEPGGCWPVVPAGLCARHRQWLHPDVLALRPHLVQVWSIIENGHIQLVLCFLFPRWCIKKVNSSSISQDSSIHNLRHSVRLDLYPSSDGGRQVWRSHWIKAKANF